MPLPGMERTLQREIIAAVFAAVQKEQSVCLRNPTLLVPQVYPHLWWAAEEGTLAEHLHALCEQAAEALVLRLALSLDICAGSVGLATPVSCRKTGASVFVAEVVLLGWERAVSRVGR